jgi:hypothetical protein
MLVPVKMAGREMHNLVKTDTDEHDNDDDHHDQENHGTGIVHGTSVEKEKGGRISSTAPYLL